MFLKGAWLIIAGVLLLGHTSVLAEPLRVYKNGVVYYYFTNREPTPPGQAGMHTPILRGEAWPQEASPHHNLPPPAVKGLIRVASHVYPEAASPQGAPGLRQLLPGTAPDLQVVNTSGAQEDIWASPRYFIRFLTKLGYRFPLALPASDSGSQGLDRHQDVSSLQESQAFAPDVGADFPQYAQQQRSEWGRVQPGSGSLPESNALPYRFPVAGPFSFRDTWGECRSGGRHHRAVDIFAWEGTEVYAITAGVIHTLATLPEAGITLLMLGQDGRGYGYMHLQGYAPGIVEGKPVRTGELLGYVGRTGLRQSAAHLHFQVYADHRLGKDALLNPYDSLVQLCHGLGVTDLYHHSLAHLENPEMKVNRIQVYRRPESKALRERGTQLSSKRSSILVIKNF